MVEAEHQSGPLARPAMHEGIDTERAAVAMQPGAACLDMRETRPPDQRTIAKHPKIAHIAAPDCKRLPTPHLNRCFFRPCLSTYCCRNRSSVHQYPCVNESQSMTSSDE